jgi:hypothetical protein
MDRYSIRLRVRRTAVWQHLHSKTAYKGGIRKVRHKGMQRRWHAGQLNIHRTPRTVREGIGENCRRKAEESRAAVEANVPRIPLSGFHIRQYLPTACILDLNNYFAGEKSE